MESLVGTAEAEPCSPAQRLLARVHNSDEDAFRELFELHAPAVRRFLRDVLRDASAADEGTQETFVRAHGRIRGLHDAGKLRAWLLGIARNVAYETVRARRGGSQLPISALEDAPTHGAPVPGIAPVPTPEALMLGGETDALLNKALGVLSEERRTALLLRLDHGLAYEEIAKTLKWSLAKVKNEIHRARLQLRVELAHHVEGKP